MFCDVTFSSLPTLPGFYSYNGRASKKLHFFLRSFVYPKLALKNIYNRAKSAAYSML